VVWTNVYGSDNKGLAHEGAEILRDPRVTNYFEARPDVVMAFGTLVPLPRDTPLAYDVYFLYGRETVWEKAPPQPLDWWHQIVDDPRFLDAAKLKERLEELLKKG
jgi:hypothetical protein